MVMGVKLVELHVSMEILVEFHMNGRVVGDGAAEMRPVRAAMARRRRMLNDFGLDGKRMIRRYLLIDDIEKRQVR